VVSPSGPHPLLEALLRRAAAAAPPEDPRLAELRRAALAGRGVLLRLSPRRAVLRIELPDGAWLLKLDAADRPFEPVRRLLRTGPALREARLHERLGPRLRWEGPALADEQPDGLSWFARPWQEGRLLSEALPEAAEAAGEGLALLHELGFRDPDLAPGDVLLRADGALLPLDLGHARMRPRGATGRAERAEDLARLLAGLPEERARLTAAPLLEGYARLAAPPCRAHELRAASRQRRRELLRKHSRRCLRDCSDFEAANGWPRRRGPPPYAGAESRWPRPDRAGALELFRSFYELELHGLRAARVAAVEAAARGAAVRALHPDGRTPAPEDDAALLDLGEEFLRAGFALDLDRLEAFRFDAQGRLWLCDPAGLLGPLR
jgi:hypothetical protein